MQRRCCRCSSASPDSRLAGGESQHCVHAYGRIAVYLSRRGGPMLHDVAFRATWSCFGSMCSCDAARLRRRVVACEHGPYVCTSRNRSSLSVSIALSTGSRPVQAGQLGDADSEQWHPDLQQLPLDDGRTARPCAAGRHAPGEQAGPVQPGEDPRACGPCPWHDGQGILRGKQ